jgi:hypothetical protein
MRSERRGGRYAIQVGATWLPGGRTSAWDALWRQIFADLEDTADKSSLGNEADDRELPNLTAEPGQDEV